MKYYVIKHQFGWDYIPHENFQTLKDLIKHCKTIYKNIKWEIEDIYELVD